jgi:hypothetical protein
MSKYENFEKEVQEVEYFITNQWELFKDQAEQVLRNFSKNQKELDELRDFFNQKLKNRVGGITVNAFEIAFDQIQEEDWK